MTNKLQPIFAPGVVAICAGNANEPSFDNLMLSLTSKQTVEEFNQLLRRGLNCNDAAPQWLHDLSDTLSNVPAAYNARTA